MSRVHLRVFAVAAGTLVALAASMAVASAFNAESAVENAVNMALFIPPRIGSFRLSWFEPG